MQAIAQRRLDSLSAYDDTALVDLARRGDEAAVRVIIQRHNRRLFRTARAVLRDDAEAEDAVQEAYMRAFTKLDGFRGESSLATWLTRIALNEALGRLRRKRASGALTELDRAAATQSEGTIIMFPLTQASANPETELAREQIRSLLEHIIDELPEAFRMVLILRDVEEMSTEDVAAHLSIKPETVKTRLHRARKLIRAALDKRFAAALPELFPFDGWRCVDMAERVVRRLRTEGLLPALPEEGR
jgi:RNA polymerase sigma-70 factor (ECF subfamily)